MTRFFLFNCVISFADTLKTISQSWDDPDSEDLELINYSRSAIAIISTPVQVTSAKFQYFWRKTKEYSIHFKQKKVPEGVEVKKKFL